MRTGAFIACILISGSLLAQKSSYKFGLENKQAKGFEALNAYNSSLGYGFDFNTRQDHVTPFFVSVDLPEGNYRLKVIFGNDKTGSVTTVKAENRRLMLENIRVPKGKSAARTFIVNIRNYRLESGDTVKINPREYRKLIWDDKLTLEFNGKNPSVRSITIEPADDVPTIFLAGNSTVVDEATEPWCGWGQMFTRFLTPEVAVANYAESGQAANTFVSSQRLEKLLSKIRKGDYLFIEFGHNDQKQKGEGKGPFNSYKNDLKYLADKAREKGASPILITPMHRRFFDENGKVINTHGEYPAAVRQLAQEENIPLIDLTAMSAVLYETWGVEGSKKAFVHFAPGTFPGQKDALADNTHFNPYGGYQIARCILKGIVDGDIPVKKYIIKGLEKYDPAKPDDFIGFSVPSSPFVSMEKPLGN